MAPVHFQSIYRHNGFIICEPLCEQEQFEKIVLTPLRSEITCPECLGFLALLKDDATNGARLDSSQPATGK